MKQALILVAITFSILNYNAALGKYDKGQYTNAYNTLLESSAPIQAYGAFGW